MVAFRLVLDTRAPRVAWGAVAGTSAGELLRVAYTVDEPELTAATLRLPDGRELVASVLADRIELYLPPDTPSGAATLVAHVVDDLGNQATSSTRSCCPQRWPASRPVRGARRIRPGARRCRPSRRASWPGRARARALAAVIA